MNYLNPELVHLLGVSCLDHVKPLHFPVPFHIVFIQLKNYFFSPIGEVFRARLRQFPALVNCCTIDWFSEWPDDALRSVAMRFLNDIPDLDATDEVMDGLVSV